MVGSLTGRGVGSFVTPSIETCEVGMGSGVGVEVEEGVGRRVGVGVFVGNGVEVGGGGGQLFGLL